MISLPKSFKFFTKYQNTCKGINKPLNQTTANTKDRLELEPITHSLAVELEKGNF